MAAVAILPLPRSKKIVRSAVSGSQWERAAARISGSRPFGMWARVKVTTSLGQDAWQGPCASNPKDAQFAWDFEVKPGTSGVKTREPYDDPCMCK